MTTSAAPPPVAGRAAPPPGHVDPRGPRTGAGLTAVLLAAVLLSGSAWLLAAQAVVFAAGAALGPGASPWGVLFRRVVRPRLGPPADWEPEGPPRTAQAVGLAFALLGLVGALLGLEPLFLGAVAAALVAALLNAFVGLCLGCEAHLAVARLRAAR